MQLVWGSVWEWKCMDFLNTMKVSEVDWPWVCNGGAGFAVSVWVSMGMEMYGFS